MGDLALNTSDSHIILGNRVVPIEDSYNKSEEYMPFLERYFTVRYVLNIGCMLGDYNVMFHSNRICVVTLAPTHFLISLKQKIVSVDFQINGNTNRLLNIVIGKWKRNAQEIEKRDSFLFYATCADGCRIGICAAIPGKLIEINPAIVNDPNIITRDPWGKGYLATILPSSADYHRFKSKMLTAEQAEEQKVFVVPEQEY